MQVLLVLLVPLAPLVHLSQLKLRNPLRLSAHQSSLASQQDARMDAIDV